MEGIPPTKETVPTVLGSTILKRFWRGNLLNFPEGISGESLRGNAVGATGPRASERESASERVSEREVFRDFQRFSQVLRGFKRLSDVLRDF